MSELTHSESTECVISHTGVLLTFLVGSEQNSMGEEQFSNLIHPMMYEEIKGCMNALDKKISLTHP